METSGCGPMITVIMQEHWRGTSKINGMSMIDLILFLVTMNAKASSATTNSWIRSMFCIPFYLPPSLGIGCILNRVLESYVEKRIVDMERIRVVPVYKLTQCLVRSVIFSKPEASVTSSFYSDVFYTVVVSRRTKKNIQINCTYCRWHNLVVLWHV